MRILQGFIEGIAMIFDIAAAPAAEGCAFILAAAAGGPAVACGAPCQSGSSYCAPHHALCHISGGSVAEARRLREIEALARAIGGRRGEAGRRPPERFLRRLERRVQVFACPKCSRFVLGAADD